jgi:hypothetical protein
MKNEQKFKQRIAEIAARIAEGAYEEDEDKKPKEEVDEANEDPSADAIKFIEKINALKTSLEPVTKLINSSKELADLLVKLIDTMPNLPVGADQQGLAKALTTIKQKSKTVASDSDALPDVSAEDEKDAAAASANKLPQLQEAYNRINRK